MYKSERVNISLYARDLRNVAGFGQGISDPFAVVTLLDEPRRILGRTEVYVFFAAPCTVARRLLARSVFLSPALKFALCLFAHLFAEFKIPLVPHGQRHSR